MSGQPALISPGHASAIEGPSSTSVWSERTLYYAEQAVANAERGERERVEQRLADPSHRWTSPEFVRTYRANSGGDRRFREEADVIRRHHYAAWLETGLAGEPFGARLLIGTGLALFARRDRWHRSPNLTVTWTLQPAHGTDAAQ